MFSWYLHSFTSVPLCRYGVPSTTAPGPRLSPCQTTGRSTSTTVPPCEATSWTHHHLVISLIIASVIYSLLLDIWQLSCVTHTVVWKWIVKQGQEKHMCMCVYVHKQCSILTDESFYDESSWENEICLNLITVNTCLHVYVLCICYVCFVHLLKVNNKRNKVLFTKLRFVLDHHI